VPPTAPRDGLVSADQALLQPGARATYVAHRAPGEWFFGAPGFLDRPEAQAARVPLERLLAGDPGLAEVCDLRPGWHAFRDEPSAPWWSGEIPHGRTFLLSYEARPTERVEDRDGIGGAFVNCWVVADDLGRASARARAHLEQTGWAVVTTIKEQVVGLAEVPAGAAAYHRQAQIDGEVYVINAFPPEAPDA
jgi:hypothetical protein